VWIMVPIVAPSHQVKILPKNPMARRLADKFDKAKQEAQSR